MKRSFHIQLDHWKLCHPRTDVRAIIIMPCIRMQNANFASWYCAGRDAVSVRYNDLRQVVHTLVPMSPSNIIWYQSRPAGQRCSSTGKVTVGLASHWPCVTDLSGLSTYGLTVYVSEMSTPPTLLMGYGTLYLYLLRRRKHCDSRQRIMSVLSVIGILMILVIFPSPSFYATTL